MSVRRIWTPCGPVLILALLPLRSPIRRRARRHRPRGRRRHGGDQRIPKPSIIVAALVDNLGMLNDLPRQARLIGSVCAAEIDGDDHPSIRSGRRRIRRRRTALVTALNTHHLRMTPEVGQWTVDVRPRSRTGSWAAAEQVGSGQASCLAGCAALRDQVRPRRGWHLRIARRDPLPAPRPWSRRP